METSLRAEFFSVKNTGDVSAVKTAEHIDDGSLKTE